MNHEIDRTESSHDDMSVLRVLLHDIRGISPVSETSFDFVPAEDEAES